MSTEDHQQAKTSNTEIEEKDVVILEFDEIDEIDPLADIDDTDIKVSRPKPRKVRKSIEDILEERALKRQLSDIFEDELLD